MQIKKTQVLIFEGIYYFIGISYKRKNYVISENKTENF